MTVGIGNTLKRLRTERGLTQKELAAKVKGGLDYTYIGKIERDEQLPSLKILIKLSDALAIPLNSFFHEEGGHRAPSFSRTGKVVNLAGAREMSTLFRELNQLHGDDIPLVVEIIRALNRHRRSVKGKGYPAPEDGCSLVAEERPGYDEGD